MGSFVSGVLICFLKAGLAGEASGRVSTDYSTDVQVCSSVCRRSRMRVLGVWGHSRPGTLPRVCLGFVWL